MNRLLIISTLIVLISCDQSRKSGHSKNQHDEKEIPSAKIVSLKTHNETKEVEQLESFEYPALDFKSPKEQSDSLQAFMERATNPASTNRQKWKLKFFCAFPNSFNRMQLIFGFDNEKGAAPLYSTDNTTRDYLDKGIFSDVIGYFSDLKSIPDTAYYKKYIAINIDGKWKADNISNAFGFHHKILNDTEDVCSVLSQYDASQIRTVFRFIFDGPHPKNDYNKKLYKNLKSKIDSQDKRLSRLLTESYENLMTEDDGHGH
ncbi:hypothetical protein [Fodinibius halophilus]|uniref:Lipoprotein n=1 Tax=Fodinibius halophilus TaxID=1736908 RepID=A0A6M1T2K5_9BACT|nr:hypothetical protein [Fodinibius halophilus]NGP89706.1 hypothetical protein [Fodinibius halophilus]